MNPPNVPKPEAPYFEDSIMFAGGRLALDFVNTFCMRRGTPLEFLDNPERLRTWLRTFSTYTGQELGSLDGPISAELFESALELRAAIRDLVIGVIQSEPPSPSALETLNQTLRANPAFPQLRAKGHEFDSLSTTKKPTETWLTEIATDAANLLLHGDLKLVRQCEADTCIRVFYDTTKNHKRRWCVEKCGSRVKSAAYYERKKGARELGSLTP